LKELQQQALTSFGDAWERMPETYADCPP
jgi:hypothetical protein